MDIDERQRYVVNSPPVVQESFGDEVVIVNLNTGAYYSLDKSGLAIWRSITRGASVGEIVNQLSARCAAERAEIAAAVDELIAALRREELVAPCSEAQHHSSAAADLDQHSAEKIVFEPPVLNKFTDVEDLLLLDPIHDVDASGWPQKR